MERLTVSDIMTTPARSVSRDTTLAEAARIMLDEEIGSVIVVDDHGRMVGIVTDSDFGSSEARVPFSTFKAPTLLDRWLSSEGVEEIYEEARERTVAEIMTKRVYTVEEDAAVREVLDVMLRRDIKHVPVVRGGEPVGMVARHDLLKMIHEQLAGG
jgi:CBS domain-containing protein